MKNFWKDLKKPILIQAPMEDVTDTVFRQIIAKCGKPDVFFTEFTNVDGMCSKGRDKVGKRLIFTPAERPIVAQLWGSNPKNFLETAKLVKQMGFDGIDVNMGCPEKSVVKKGLCGALIDNQPLAKEIILSVKEGAGGLPISIKTRIGVKNIQTEEWASFLLEQNPDCLIIHGRTVAEMSDFPTHWDEIGKVAKLRDSMKLKTLIIGNGDVKSYKEALEKSEKYNLDGIMIGRGIFNNLWIYNKNIDPEKISYQEKLKLLIEHINLFDKTWDPFDKLRTKNFSLMKKFYRIYISGMPDAHNVRMKLMEFKTAEDTLNFLKSL
jgi:tRNA-dihydrouridine synthase